MQIVACANAAQPWHSGLRVFFSLTASPLGVLRRQAAPSFAPCFAHHCLAIIEMGVGDSDNSGASSNLESMALQNGAANDSRDPKKVEFLDLMDKIHSEQGGFGLDLEVPQLVVCPDTSSGRSSVLEAIIGIDLPRSGAMCTSFVTEYGTYICVDADVLIKYSGSAFAQALTEKIFGFIVPANNEKEKRKV